MIFILKLFIHAEALYTYMIRWSPTLNSRSTYLSMSNPMRLTSLTKIPPSSLVPSSYLLVSLTTIGIPRN